ncbi:MAG: exosortase/archaeosortase family protein [Sedimentisphaerales bacterium]|nr:exosortase/archaeosortase family protein [Sedimentisphaerales bacterium]
MVERDEQESQAETVTESASGESNILAEARRSLFIERCWKFGIIGVLFVWLFYDETARLVDRWGTATESHGMLIPAFSLYFVYLKRRQLAQIKGRWSLIGLGVMIFSIWIYLYSFFMGFSYPRSIAMIIMLGGIVLFLGGWQIIRLVWLPILFLLFAIPLPVRLYYEISMPMREMASMVAAAILNMLPNIDCEATGVVIHGTHLGEDISLNVAEACSGMRLLRAFVALSVAMAYLEYRPILHRVILLVSSVPIAVFCNMLRVLLTGLIYIYVGKEYATGTLHSGLGILMLVVAFSLYGLITWVLNRIYVEEDHEEEGILVVKRGE